VKEKLQYQSNDTEIVLSRRVTEAKAAWLSMVQTTVVIALLVVCFFLLSTDITKIVVVPVQKMVESIQYLADNPFAFFDTKAKKEMELAKQIQMEDQEDGDESSEFKLLSGTLTKISRLLALGFGQAGRNIIKNAIMSQDDVDVMIPGQKCHGVFMFTDIRNFTDVTECLGKEVMVFVNQVAQIVHDCTHIYDGTINKNIGDAFLCVWPLQGETRNWDMEKHSSAVATGRKSLVKQMARNVPSAIKEKASQAFIAVVKMKIEIERSMELSSYRNNTSITSRLKNYKVRCGFGLHAGWAIEGAIGSNWKIDATYLSPHVNITARLESATKQFGVEFLLSGEFVQLLSRDAQRMCRLIDRVTVKGSASPIELYTIDISYDEVFEYERTSETQRRGAKRTQE